MPFIKHCKCGKRIEYSEIYCIECASKHVNRQSEYDKEIRHKRDKQYTIFYKSSEWKAVRISVIARDNGLCQQCLENKKIRCADMVHHKIELKSDWTKRLDMNNLISLCNQCHAEIDHKNKGG